MAELLNFQNNQKMNRKLKLFLFIALLINLGSACKSDKKNQKSSTKEKKTIQTDTYHYAYSLQMKQPGSNKLTPSGSTEMYLSKKAVRSKVKMKVMGQNTEMLMIVKAENPKEFIMLNSKNKTYSIINPDDLKMGGEMGEKMKEMSQDSLTVLGKEKMNGYACTHLKIVTTVNVPESLKKMMGNSSSVKEYWVSKEIPGISLFNSWLKSQPKMMKGMDSEIYQYGVPVKMVSKEGDETNMVMELTAAKEQNPDKNLFEIPTGYTKNQ